jgi:hypothetical protein
MQLCLASFYFLAFKYKYSPQESVIKTINILHLMWEVKFHINYYNFEYLTFTFLHSRQEDKNSKLNCKKCFLYLTRFRSFHNVVLHLLLL